MSWKILVSWLSCLWGGGYAFGRLSVELSLISKTWPHFGQLAISGLFDIFTHPKKNMTMIAKTIAGPPCPRDANHAQNPIAAENDINFDTDTIVMFTCLPLGFLWLRRWNQGFAYYHGESFNTHLCKFGDDRNCLVKSDIEPFTSPLLF